MSAGPTPAQLLAAARVTLTKAEDWGSAWPQAVAFLTRQALEDALDQLWSGPTAGMRDCSTAHQLICLPYYLDDVSVAGQTSQCWHAISSACHAHPYELNPTAGELSGWIDDVQQLLNSLTRTVPI
jgi:hypothetical protein